MASGDDWRGARGRHRTPGLNRLELLSRARDSLFQGSRRTHQSHAYLEVPTTVWDPEPNRDRVQGVWAPRLGLLKPYPLVRYVLANPTAAAIAALIQGATGSPPWRSDQFSDKVIGITFCETQLTRGALREAVAEASALEDDRPLGRYFVNVLRRADFASDRLAYPVPGEYVSTTEVQVKERVALCAGDVRALAELLSDVGLVWTEESASCLDPFSGPFARGGHLQFHSASGEQLRTRRTPAESDRRLALEQAAEQASRWLNRTRAAAHETGSLADLGEREPPAASPLERAIRYIEENCTRTLTVREIGAAAFVSGSHLHALFRQSLGCTPLGYASELRLKHAERLLAETDLRVAEIAERCGFSELACLTHSLKRRRGQTPTQIRRRYQRLEQAEP